jgi:hypothetical protein
MFERSLLPKRLSELDRSQVEIGGLLAGFILNFCKQVKHVDAAGFGACVFVNELTCAS